MPKADRAAAIKKDNAKGAKKLQADLKAAEKERKEAEQEDEDEPRTASAPRSASGAKSKSAFARAAQTMGDDDDEDEEPEAPVQEAPAAKSKKEAAAEKKQKKKNGYADEMQLLQEEQRAAMKQRIVNRFLRMLGVGFFMQDKEEAPKETKPRKPTNSGKKSKNGASEDDRSSLSVAGLRAQADKYGGIFMLLALGVLIFAVRLGEEGYSPGFDDSAVDYYEVMGIPRGSDVLAVRKAYKGLALSLHPDKNPNCLDCRERFEQISEAYETLNNPEKKAAYDSRRKHKGAQASDASMDLTADEFEHVVLRSNDVWYVQVMDPGDEACKSFHPIWEEVALNFQDVAKFGRLDMVKQKKALSFLPQRVVITPLIVRFARGEEPELYLWSGREERGGSAFLDFLIGSFPQLEQPSETPELRQWWSGARPKLLLVGPAVRSKRGETAKADTLMKMHNLAFRWAEFVDIAITEPTAARDVVGSDNLAKNRKSWTLVYGPAGGGPARMLGDVIEDRKDIPGALQVGLGEVLGDSLPYLTARSYQQLCSPGSLSTAQRTYCLVLVDLPDSDLQRVRSELNTSRVTYAQEALEAGTSEEEGGGSETPHVQAVRVSTVTSRWPWKPTAVGSAFTSLWRETKWAPAFVLELESRRVAPKRTALDDIMQQVAYDDLKFSDLPEGVSIARGMPDPEAPLKRELLDALTTVPGALSAFLLVAAAAAVLPELSLPAICASAGVAWAMVVFCWPAAFRRVVALVAGGAVV